MHIYVSTLPQTPSHPAAKITLTEFPHIYNGVSLHMGFLGGSVVKKSPAKLEDWRPRLDPWVRMIPGGENGKPLQYSCLGNPMDRGTWQAIVHEVT